MESSDFERQHETEITEVERNTLSQLTTEAYGYVQEFAKHKIREFIKSPQLLAPRPKNIEEPTKIKLPVKSDIRGVEENFSVIFGVGDKKLETTVTSDLDSEVGHFSVDNEEGTKLSLQLDQLGRYSVDDMIKIMSSVRNKYVKILEDLY